MVRPIDESFAALLRMTRADYVETTADGISVRQAGAAYIAGPVDVPKTPFALTGGEPAIETFLTDANGSTEPMGDNERLIQVWQPAAAQLAAAVYAAAEEHRIPLEGPGYLTVSALPLSEVSHEPHYDDGQFDPADGVSVVAIVANYGGTRTTEQPIRLPATQPGLPLGLPADTMAAFEDRLHPSVESEPGRIVVFPQFGQLHSGPHLSDRRPDVLRTLLVMRVKTAPATST